MDYQSFIAAKSQSSTGSGFETTFLPDCMFPFQKHATSWAVRTGRAEIIADCGLGKSLCELVWAENVLRHTNKPVLLLTPIAVGKQMAEEAEKFGIACKRSRDGKITSEKTIWITNYEQLHKFNPDDFGGCVGDEAGCIKDFKSQRKESVTEFMRTMPYRLLATATAAPNDYWELGTASEALGYLGFRDMITTFFKQETQKDHCGWGRTKYRFRGHAESPFWKWVCSWAMCFRKPSDIGPFDDAQFQLPELIEKEIIVETAKCRDGMLFPVPAKGLKEEREERRISIVERCEMAADLASQVGKDPCVLWCELNPEGDLLEKMIPDSIQVSGSMSDDEKEESFSAFSSGECKRLVIKPKIGAWGLNWQHCADTIVFPSHSFERYYQLTRRFFRFGQKRPVKVTSIVNEGETGVLKSIARKSAQAERMFSLIAKHMNDPSYLTNQDFYPVKERIPLWAS